MKTKKGFTLIELLAVIVILAIIALIATPIILNIISDAKEESNERSVELYASAVKNAVAKYQLSGTEVTPGSYTSSSDGKTLTKGETELTVEYNGNVSCTTIEIYEDGNIYLAGCNGDYTYGIKQESFAKLSKVCTLTSGTALTAGAKYLCQVNDTTSYNFYVLTTPQENDTTINLIMDRNICEDGSPSTETKHCTNTFWISKTDFVSAGGSETDWNKEENLAIYGPITAMTKIDEATSDWTNLSEITVDYFTDYYGTIYEMTPFTTYARLPYLSEVDNYDAVLNNAYLYDNLKLYCWDDNYNDVSCDVATTIDGVYAEGISHMEVDGYLTLTFDYTSKFEVEYNCASNTNITSDAFGGLRPVITLSI